MEWWGLQIKQGFGTRQTQCQILPDVLLGKTLSFSEPQFLKLRRATSIWEVMSLKYLVLRRPLINIRVK